MKIERKRGPSHGKAIPGVWEGGEEDQREEEKQQEKEDGEEKRGGGGTREVWGS